jgi:hypothetical protein
VHGEPHWEVTVYIRRMVANFEDTIEDRPVNISHLMAGSGTDCELRDRVPASKRLSDRPNANFDKIEVVWVNPFRLS